MTTNLPTPQARLLARLMSDISEDYFCAGWLIDCEYSLWVDLTGQALDGVKSWGLTAEEKEELRFIHEHAGGWIVWLKGANEKMFLSTEE